MKKIIITALLIVGFTISSNAQSSFWSINWPISTGIGSQKDFIGETSFRGIDVDGRSFVNDNISIGGNISWHVFKEVLRDLPPLEIEKDGIKGDISGTQYRYLNILPILANAHYYVDKSGDLNLYLGIGLGTVYVEERTDIGLTSFQNDSWRFGFQPEIGMFFPFGISTTGANVSLKYLYGTSSSDLNAISMLSLNIGIGFLPY